MATAQIPSERLQFRGLLKGHGGWVTSIAFNVDRITDPNVPVPVLVSASRDKSVIVWRLTGETDDYGYPLKRLTGHSHYVQDVALSSDAQFALSASWDATLRLWDLRTGLTTRRFVGHTKDVLSVAFSADNRQIVSASRDKTINLWNTLGNLKFTIKENGHTEWVSCVRFSPLIDTPLVVSGGWDNQIKVWDLNHCKLHKTLGGEGGERHKGYVNTLTVSPEGSLCASGGKDGVVMLWNLNTNSLKSCLNAGDIIHSLVFSPTRFWLCAATATSIKIWDLYIGVVLEEIKLDLPPRGKRAVPIQCISLAWSVDGNTLFSGWTDNHIRVYEVL